jgi:Zn-dependent peptidase ImmA (M78 family)
VIDLSPTVERFPIAHELGHALLDDGGAACAQAMIGERADAASLAEVMDTFDPEATASAIASQLLAPSPWLRRAVLEGRSVPELQGMFDVTLPVIFIAIKRDRLLNRVRS